MAISELKGKIANAQLWIPVEEVESSALSQLRNICSLPWVAKVAVMPDVHYGKGATVGSVIAMKGAVSPAAVGVDIGCGMAAVRTNLKASDLPDDLKQLRSAIEQTIPVGFNSNKTTSTFVKGMGHLWTNFHELDPHVQSLRDKAMLQCGTLGGGNHFIELCLDGDLCSTCTATGTKPYTNEKCHQCNDGFKDPTVWLMLHSGSRNIGKELAEIHISRAKELTHNQSIVDRDLAVFLANTPEFKAYRRDLDWAQSYALMNRVEMLRKCREVMESFFPNFKYIDVFNCHHNYVNEENIDDTKDLYMVTRKGAISARKGQYGIIPGSMGAKSFIVKGLGNPEALFSASHGAGRKMSRGKAKKTFTLDDLEQQTTGVECRKDAGVIDEIPGCYKDIAQVMAYQSDLVEIVAELKQVLCIKG